MAVGAEDLLGVAQVERFQDTRERLLDDPDAYWQDDWLRAGALYAASELAPESAAAAALTRQDAADPVLAETARSVRGERAHPSPPRVG